MEGFEDDVERLRRQLRTLELDPPPPASKLGAVLVPLLEHVIDSPERMPVVEGSWRLVLTRRTSDLRSHAGEISFPGGRVDPQEHPREAALREAREELGIAPEKVDVLGPLPPVATNVSGYVISSWVGVLAPAIFTPNPAEIAEVIEVPLESLRSPGARREQRFIRAGTVSVSPAYDVGPNTIWGATARIISHLLDLIG